MNAIAHAPKQARSRRTLDAMVEAAEALLEQRPFGELTVQAVAAAAGCTTGAFYARFQAKEDLLPYLYERYDEAHAAHLEALLASRDWPAASLKELLTALIDETIGAYAARPHLLREIALFVRRDPDNAPAAGVARRARLQGVALQLLADKATGPGEPVGLARASFAMTVIGNMAREAVLFGEAPLARATAQPHDVLRRELLALVLGYLDQPVGA